MSCTSAAQIAAVGALVHEPDLIRRLPKVCPYDWDTIWHRDVSRRGGVDLGDPEAGPTAGTGVRLGRGGNGARLPSGKNK